MGIRYSLLHCSREEENIQKQAIWNLEFNQRSLHLIWQMMLLSLGAMFLVTTGDLYNVRRIQPGFVPTKMMQSVLLQHTSISSWQLTLNSKVKMIVKSMKKQEDWKELLNKLELIILRKLKDRIKEIDNLVQLLIWLTNLLSELETRKERTKLILLDVALLELNILIAYQYLIYKVEWWNQTRLFG